MMKRMGIEVPDVANEDAELAALMKQAGVQKEEANTEEALLAELGLNMVDEDMSDEAMLAQLDGVIAAGSKNIIEEGKALKSNMDELREQCKQLRDAKKID